MKGGLTVGHLWVRTKNIVIGGERLVHIHRGSNSHSQRTRQCVKKTSIQKYIDVHPCICEPEVLKGTTFPGIF